MKYRIGYTDSDDMTVYAVKDHTFEAETFRSEATARDDAVIRFAGKQWFVEPVA